MVTPLEIPESTEWIAKQVINAAFVVHKELGPGLLESSVSLLYLLVNNRK
ncbi:MAG: hypothetical protein M1472_00535 [Planctomycetes bacterium]|nr:hypothetical protein [Planctomycetota bacterium]